MTYDEMDITLDPFYSRPHGTVLTVEQAQAIRAKLRAAEELRTFVLLKALYVSQTVADEANAAAKAYEEAGK